MARGEVDPDDIDPDLFGRYLPSSTLLPPLDLLIRTSGERRVSNFFLWEVAYAELYFSPVMWPDFGETELWSALREYGHRERRFGLTSDQLDTETNGSVNGGSVNGVIGVNRTNRTSPLESLEVGLGDPMPETG